jgi:hypothetical protein
MAVFHGEASCPHPLTDEFGTGLARMADMCRIETTHVIRVSMRRSDFRTRGYESRRLFRRAIFAVGVTVCCAGLLQACSGTEALAPVPPSNATPIGNVAGSAIVGKTLDAPVRLVVTGADSLPIAGAVVRWVAANGGVVSQPETVTDARGIASVRWTLGTTAGLQTLTAQVAGLPPVVFGANAVADRAARIQFNSDLVRIPLIGDTLRISTAVTDRYGNAVPASTALALESGSDVLTVSGGQYVARHRGTAVIRATADTATARLTVMVDPAPPEIRSVSPDTLQPGAPVVIEGLGFALIPEAVELTIAGLRATIRSAAGSRIEADLPLSYPCLATGPQIVKVTVEAASSERLVTFHSATRVALRRGESANIVNADAVRCTELVAPSGGAHAKYVVSVINTSATAAATSGFELRGAGAGAMSGRAASPIVAVPRMSSASTSPQRVGLTAAMTQHAFAARHDAAHEDYLESQRALARRIGSPVTTWRARSRTKGSAASTTAQSAASLGDTLVLNALYSSCAGGHAVHARVVYAGVRALVLEDISAPRAGSMDEQYRLIGEEFDQVQYPLLARDIADPLAMNGVMGGDGRVTMLFTRYVNDSLPGISGYVTACNFFAKTTFAASNEDEVFYARVAAAGESPGAWRRSMRSTVMHESKHLASFAVRFVDATPFEESWLEESLARVAEELYSRTFANGGSWKGNAGFQSTVRCELEQCDDRPLMMWKHFSVLHQYLRGIDTLTPIGAAANGDFTFYASGWSLVRWAADHYAGHEGTWLKSLVRGGQLSGLSNLAQHTGRPASEMLADWALTHAVDNLPGFTPARPQLSFPSWNSRDIFTGLSSSYPGVFVPDPLNARAMSFGAFTLPVARLRAFSSSYFSFEGSQTGSQVLELRGESGVATPPASLRMAIVRVQ